MPSVFSNLECEIMAKAKIHLSDVRKNNSTTTKISTIKKTHVTPGTLGEFWYSDIKCTDDFMATERAKKMTTKEFLKSMPALGDDFVITKDNNHLENWVND